MPSRSLYSVLFLSVSGLVLSAATTTQSATRDALTVTARARSVRPGELVVLTVRAAAPIAELHARAFDREQPAFAVDARTWRVLIGIDLETTPRTYPVEIVANPQA